jgi:hypothetical protein
MRLRPLRLRIRLPRQRTRTPSSARRDNGTLVTQGWYTQPSGGYTGAGCSGMYLNKWAHPLSMHMYRTLTWWFLTGIRRVASCRVAVYIPRGNTTTVGASPARYTVLTGRGWTAAGSFTLNQPSHRGKWLYAGAFRSRAGRIAVRVNNVGYGSVMVAADAVGVDCVA